MTRLVVVTAGLSQPSSTRLLADRLAEAVDRALATGDAGVEATGMEANGMEANDVEGRSHAEIAVVELRDLAHDVVNNVITGFPPPALARVVDQIAEADGLIAVTPIFNASYSGLFKSFFDVLDPDLLRGKPVLIGATGGSQRHSLALEHAVRPLFSYLHAFVVPTSVYAASADWGTVEGAALAERIERAGAELAELIRSRAGSSNGGKTQDPYSRVPSFIDLLGN
jgi:FMN reductase